MMESGTVRLECIEKIIFRGSNNKTRKRGEGARERAGDTLDLGKFSVGRVPSDQVARRTSRSYRHGRRLGAIVGP